MKRIIEILCLSFLLLGTVSCHDLLNPEPENSVTFYNFFETEEDVATVIDGLHSMYRYKFTIFPWFEASGELIDHVSEADDAIHGLRDLDGTLVTDASPYTSWAGWYNMISQVLVLSENIDRANLPEDRYNYYMGQAMFFRALSYFKVIQTWGDCPYVDVSYELQARGREPWQKMLDLAIEDAIKAFNMLEPWSKLVDSKGTRVTSKQIPGKEAASALLAHMYAWKGSLCNDNEALQKGIEAATFVIENGGFSLAANPEEVCTKVMMGGHSESIFEVELTWSELDLYGSYHMESLYQGYPIVPYWNIADIISNTLHVNGKRVLEMYKDGDLRKDAYFYMVDSMINNVDTYGYALMQKRREVVLDKTSEYPQYWYRNLDGNVIIYRLADIILLRAEMYAKKGDATPAITDLNTIRDRAKAKLYDASEGDLYYAIFKEREKELIAERHRRSDIIRTGFYGELSEAWGKLSPQDIEDGAVYSPVSSSAFYDNSLMRQNRFWAKQW